MADISPYFPLGLTVLLSFVWLWLIFTELLLLTSFFGRIEENLTAYSKRYKKEAGKYVCYCAVTHARYYKNLGKLALVAPAGAAITILHDVLNNLERGNELNVLLKIGWQNPSILGVAIVMFAFAKRDKASYQAWLLTS